MNSSIGGQSFTVGEVDKLRDAVQESEELLLQFQKNSSETVKPPQ